MEMEEQNYACTIPDTVPHCLRLVVERKTL